MGVATDALIADLERNQYSLQDQNVIAQIPLLIASLQELETGGGGGGVPSIAGTPFQITQVGSPGAVTLSIPNDFRPPGTVNKLTFTMPATGATFTLADGKTLTIDNSLEFKGTDGSIVDFGTGGTVVYAAGAVTSITGTANQIDASAATGPVTLSLDPNVQTTTLALNGASIGTDHLAVTGTASISGLENVGGINLTSATLPANGFDLQAANTIGISVNSANRFNVTTASFNSGNANGASLMAAAATGTAPSLIVNRSSTTTGFGAQASGNISGIIAGVEVTRITANGEAILKTFTVATLPANLAGLKTYVTDAAAVPVFSAAVSGGGTLFLPVYNDGAAWRNG